MKKTSLESSRVEYALLQPVSYITFGMNDL